MLSLFVDENLDEVLITVLLLCLEPPLWFNHPAKIRVSIKKKSCIFSGQGLPILALIKFLSDIQSVS